MEFNGLEMEELRETRTWIWLIVKSELLPENRISTSANNSKNLK